MTLFLVGFTSMIFYRMTREEFEKIIKIRPKNVNLFYKEIYRNWFDKRLDYLISIINCDGNYINTDREGNNILRKIYYTGEFSGKEFDIILPHIYYNDFNKDFEKVAKKVFPLFDKIKPYWKDIPLEINQGIFSFGTMPRITRCETLWDLINKPENGKLYCDTLLKIYPMFKDLVDKYDCGWYSLYRFCQILGY